MANMNVTVIDGNNLVVNVDKGVSGVGIESVSIVYQDPYYYLDIQYTNGTNELVQLPSIVAGVVSFNTRIGVVTLEFTDVTDALGYTPPEPDGTGATGTWNISVTGNAATVTNGVYTTGTYSNPLWITALAGSKITGDISGNAENVNGTVAVTHGGTGQITANDGFNALAPSQTGNAGKYLKTDGANAAWDQLDISTADITGTLPVNHGGTGATNAADARTNLNAVSQSTTVSAGTGLSGGGDLSANRTISIADTGVTAATKGSASKTVTATVNAQGQLTSLTEQDIAIANTQISGLGTMSTQNASNVSITGGSITGITDLAIADGGTGASTAADARTNLGLGTSAVLNAGVANGVATLDSAGTVPLSQINPALIGSVSYQGTWNASTNTPTLTSSVGTKGYYYVVSVAGSTNLNGITNWNLGDWAIFDGSSWGKVDNTDSVTSVNGYTGAVVLSYSDVGAPSTSGTNATGTWGISVSGNAGTVTNGVYTTDVGTVTNTMLAGSIANNKLANSTISGVSLGSNLNALTIGSGLSGTSYDGSTAVTITNTAPDQIVSLTSGTGINASGTYPNFTITNTAPDQIVSLTGGTGISTSGTYPSFTVTNTAPDQVVSLTGAGTTTVTGAYPNFTITSNDAYTGTVISVGTGTGLTGGPITTTGTISFSDANVGTWAATPSSANLAAAMTDETGSGSLVFGTNPTLSSPNINVIDFDQTYATTLTAGQMGWDGHDTLGLGMVGGNVIQRIGEDQYYYVKASSAITKGQVVMFTGAVGASGVITAAPASGLTDGSYIMGVAAESIALNGLGLIQVFGNLKGLDTSAFTLGDILWYDPAVTGGLTATKPSAPNVKVQVAAVTNAGNGGSGSIQIRVSSGSTLGGTDSNVQFGTLSTNDLIQYNGTYWTNIAPSSLAGVGSVANSLTFNNSGTGDASGSTFNGSAAKTLSYNSIGAQPTLISGTNIKTVNGTSLLGSGDLGTIGIGYGGTGQTTANAAFNALAPSQTGNSGKYLTTDGTNTSWAANPLGTVTSVSGTGTVSGITLTGTVTTSGNLTLGGSLDLSSPPAIGGTMANTGAFTSLTATSGVVNANTSSDALRITQTGSGNALVVEDSANPDSTPFVINSSGLVVVGNTTSITSFPLEVNSTSGVTANRWSSTGGGAYYDLRVSRGSIGNYTIAQDSDDIGYLRFLAADGSAFIPAAQIFAEVDGTPGTNDMPGRLVFSTTADGASSPSERMRIDNYGSVGVGGTAGAGYTMYLLKNPTGAIATYGLRNGGTIQSDVTSQHNVFYSRPATAASAFTVSGLYHYRATQGTFGAGSAVTSQHGFIVDSDLTGATNNYGFYSNIASGTGRYNFYAAGSAANYFAGDMQFAKTVTAAGTTGAQTINKTAGTVNFAAAATSLVVTNSLVTNNSIIVCTVGTNDSTMKSVSAVAGAGSFTLYANAAATAETRVNFIVIN